MSYCTFSSDDYRCDVWAASLLHTNQIVVAFDRVVGDIPFTENLDNLETQAEYNAAWDEQMAFLKTAERELINHPDAGKTFQFEDFQEFRDKMQELHQDGLRIPDAVMAELAAWSNKP